MEDLFFTILSGFAELLAEVILQLAAEAVAAFLDFLIRKVKAGPIPVSAWLGYLMLGAAFGAVSVLLFPHPLVHPSKFHGVSLIISPVITGTIMSLIGLMHRRQRKESLRIESFGYGFTFALGLAVIRLLFV